MIWRTELICVQGNTVCFSYVRIAYTGFEEPTVVGGNRIDDYSDTSGSTEDHMLADNSGENPIAYRGDQELGFRTWWFNIESSNRALESPIGVVSDTMADNSQQIAHSGSQYYIMVGPKNFVVLETGNVLCIEDFYCIYGCLHSTLYNW
jgi:hypothetical protein